MKIYNVGKDPLGEYDLEYLDERIYEYFIYNYEGYIQRKWCGSP